MKDKIRKLFTEATGGKVELTDEFFDGLVNLVESQAVIIADKKVSRLEESMARQKKQLSESVQNKVGKNQKALEESITGFMNHAVNEWALNNEQAISSSLMVESARSLFNNVQSLLGKHGLTVDTTASALVESKDQEIARLKSQLNKSESRLMESKNETVSMKRAQILESVSGKADLAATQKERLVTLSEDVKFLNEKSFTGKITTLIESIKAEETPKKKAEPSRIPLVEDAKPKVDPADVWANAMK